MIVRDVEEGKGRRLSIWPMLWIIVGRWKVKRVKGQWGPMVNVQWYERLYRRRKSWGGKGGWGPIGISSDRITLVEGQLTKWSAGQENETEQSCDLLDIWSKWDKVWPTKDNDKTIVKWSAKLKHICKLLKIAKKAILLISNCVTIGQQDF